MNVHCETQIFLPNNLHLKNEYIRDIKLIGLKITEPQPFYEAKFKSYEKSKQNQYGTHGECSG